MPTRDDLGVTEQGGDLIGSTSDAAGGLNVLSLRAGVSFISSAVRFAPVRSAGLVLVAAG